MKLQILNFITGLLGFVTFVILVRGNEQYAISLSFAILLTLVGFGGANTIISILKEIKEIKRD